VALAPQTFTPNNYRSKPKGAEAQENNTTAITQNELEGFPNLITERVHYLSNATTPNQLDPQNHKPNPQDQALQQ